MANSASARLGPKSIGRHDDGARKGQTTLMPHIVDHHELAARAGLTDRLDQVEGI
jgi:hypothetical protein